MGDSLSQRDERLLSQIRAELAEMRRDYRGASTYPTSAPSAPNVVRAIEQMAHGFDIGTTIYFVDPDWVLTDGNTTRTDVVGVVASVVDDDNVLVVFYGAMCLPGLADYSIYYLDPAADGTITATRPTSGRIYPILVTMGDELAWVGGSRDLQMLANLDDVVLTTPQEADMLFYNAMDEVWENRPFAFGDLPTIAGLSVLGRSANTTGVVAAITATTTGQVFRMGASALEWNTLDTASYNNSSVTYAKIQDVAGLSVVGRSANSSGVAAAITAGTDDFVLRRSGTTVGFGQVATGGIVDLAVTAAKLDALAVTTAKIDNNAVTTSKMSISIVAGSAGSAANVPVLTWDQSGRLTSVTTAALSLALDDLSDVTITAVASLDFLRRVGGAWVNQSLGALAYVAGTPNQLVFDGGTGGTAAAVGIGHASSRFVLGGAFPPLDFILQGNPVGATDKCARIRAISATEVGFFDQANAAGNGTQVIKWTTGTSVATRAIEFIGLSDFKISFSSAFTLESIPIWFRAAGAADYQCRQIIPTSTGLVFCIPGTSSSGVMNPIQLYTGASNAQDIRIGEASFMSASQVNTITIVGDVNVGQQSGSGGSTSVFTISGDTKLAGATNKLGFFGNAGAVKATAAAPSAVATTQTAGGTYTANEQTMLGNLKTDVTNLRGTVAALRTALAAYNQIG